MDGAYLHNEENLRKIVSEAGEKEWRSIVDAHSGNMIEKAFPAPDSETVALGDIKGKYVILDDVEYPARQFYGASGEFVYVGKPSTGYWFVDLAGRDWLGLYEAVKRYRRNVDSGMAEKDFSEWFAQSGVSMDPGPRAYLKDLVMGYRKFIKEEHQTIALDMHDVIEEFNSESSVVGRLRKCNFTKHRAFFADGTEATGGTPHYTRRIGFLGKAVKTRFEKAVRAVFQRHGKPMILYQ